MRKLKRFITDFGPEYGKTECIFTEFFYHKIVRAEFSRMRGFNLIITYERYDQPFDLRFTRPLERRIRGIKLDQEIPRGFEPLGLGGCSAIIPQTPWNIFNGFEEDRFDFYIEKLNPYHQVP